MKSAFLLLVVSGLILFIMVGCSGAGGTTPVVAPAPTQLVASPGNSQVLLNWISVSEATGYHVYRSQTSGMQGSAIASPTNANYTDSSVTNGTEYFYQVTATNAAGESGPSSQVSALPLIAPAPPASLVAAAGNGKILLNWVQALGATGYNVYQDGLGSKIASIAGTSYNVTGLLNGMPYTFYVTATNATGGESLPSSVTATPAP